MDEKEKAVAQKKRCSGMRRKKGLILAVSLTNSYRAVGQSRQTLFVRMNE
jgi:hypothetical protein